MGVKPITYFDTFVQEWYEQGGEELTEQIRRSNPGEWLFSEMPDVEMCIRDRHYFHCTWYFTGSKPIYNGEIHGNLCRMDIPL